MKIVVALIFIHFLSFQVSCALIKWTAASGSNLWTSSRNWDCNCVPSAADDVVIDLLNINGSVVVPADGGQCNSLTVGGTSATSQTLQIQGILTVGKGGGSIKGNGQVILYSSDTLPFICNGNFVANDKFQFVSGMISGTGTFSFTDLSLVGAPQKTFNASATVSGTLSINPGTGSTGVIKITSYPLTISGKMVTSQNLIVSSSEKGEFIISGELIYSGPGDFSVGGPASFSKLTISTGNVIFNDNVAATTVTVANGATLSLVSQNTRTIAGVTGLGTLQIQGGKNNIGSANLGNVKILAGSLTTTSKLVFTNLDINSGVFFGGQISSTNAHLSNAVLDEANLITTNLQIDGFTSMTKSIINVTSLATTVSASQFTLDDSTLKIESSASVAQSFPLKLFPSGIKVSNLVNNGKWTQTSSLSCNVNSYGQGSWSLEPGSAAEITGVSWATAQLSLTSALLHSASSNISINSVDGKNGNITIDGINFMANTLNVATFNLRAGNAVITTGTVGSLNIQNGNFNVTSSVKIDALTMQGGNLGGGSKTKRSMVSITNSTFTSNFPKNLNDLQFLSRNIEVTCGSEELCQIFTHNTFISTKVPSYRS